jgi:hypothetical protein
MTERKENWILFITPENVNKIGSPMFIKELLSIDKLDNSLENTVNRVFDRLNRIENRLDAIEYPQKKAKILELLSNGESHSRDWINNRISASWWTVDKMLNELIEEKKLATFKSGTHPMYTLIVGE